MSSSLSGMVCSFAIRQAAGADGAAISRLIGGLAHHRSLDPHEPASEAFFAGFAPETISRHLIDPRYCYLVATSGDTVVGVLGIRDRISIQHLFVSERFQRRGIARTLWERAKQQGLVATEQGSVLVKSSMYAIPVYERFGFVPTGSAVHEHGVTYVPMELASSAVRVRLARDSERGSP